MSIITNYMYQILVALLVAFFGWLGVQVKNLVKKYVNTKVKENICAAAVRFVEQTCKEIHGREKLFKAMQKARDVLSRKYSIIISDEELEMLVEAAVNEFNNSFKKTDPAVKTRHELDKTFGPDPLCV